MYFLTTSFKNLSDRATNTNALKHSHKSFSGSNSFCGGNEGSRTVSSNVLSISGLQAEIQYSGQLFLYEVKFPKKCLCPLFYTMVKQFACLACNFIFLPSSDYTMSMAICFNRIIRLLDKTAHLLSAFIASCYLNYKFAFWNKKHWLNKIVFYCIKVYLANDLHSLQKSMF